MTFMNRVKWSLIVLLLILISITSTLAAEADDEIDPKTGKKKKPKCDGKLAECEPGNMLPVWEPTKGLAIGDRIGRGVVYFVCLCYMFIGVSIIADRFMSAIEVITSKERKVKLKRVTGEEYTVLVRVWNETVSNLTLMALGSSAPEILLSIIEIVGNNFEAGALGPGTIVGSAAFNFYIIIGVCIYVIPSPDTRRVNHIYVFWVTLCWSIFAYIWLYYILLDDEIKLWEGIVTFLFFPLTVATAYAADRKMWGIFGQRYMGGNRPTTGFTSTTSPRHALSAENLKGTGDSEAQTFEAHRQHYIEIFKRLRIEHPGAPIETLEQLAEQEAIKSAPKSRAFYRIQATRKMVGGGDISSSRRIEEHLKQQHEHEELENGPLAISEQNVVKLYFAPGHYTCLENCGFIRLTVVCDRINVSAPCSVQVDFRTADGTAEQKSDYVAKKGTLVFKPQQNKADIEIEIIDNDLFEEDEEFAVHLSNAKLLPVRGGHSNEDISYRGGRNGHSAPPLVKLGAPSVATVLIVDNDHAGQFLFQHETIDVSESEMVAQINVMRVRGARGAVAVPYKTIDGTAKAHKDYTPTSGRLMFKDEQTEATIHVRIVCDDEYEKSEDFTVQLEDPIWYDENGRVREADKRRNSEEDEGGNPELGAITRCKVIIKENKEFKSFVDKMLKSTNASVMVGTSSWKQQFVEAVTVEGGDEDDDEGSQPGCFDYVMHSLTMPWKLIFALVPPTDYGGGWWCFIVSIVCIGVMTALIGDLASHFGCTVGLKDSVNALTLVALGTSVPDTFASKVAAMSDPYADSSIGNVTGSNAVNVFLGIGIAWMLAAIVHTWRGTKFIVTSGSLGFSVTLFCVGGTILVILLQLRRHLGVFGKAELGGPFTPKVLSALAFFLVWLTYIALSAMEAYCVIPGF